MRPFRLMRWILVPLGTGILFLWSILHTTETCPSVEKGSPAVLYSSGCQDNMRTVFEHALNEAKESIHLIIYAFTDKKLLNTLQKRADEGVKVRVQHDVTSNQRGFTQLSKPVSLEPINASGIMHEKILITDDAKVWVGSANWTKTSLISQENLVVGLHSPELAHNIQEGRKEHRFVSEGQQVEFWSAQKDRKKALDRLLLLIYGAQTSLRIGMFAWTHNDLTEAAIDAHRRGVNVEVILDRQMSSYVNKATLKKLAQAGVAVRVYKGRGNLHHKFAWIDETTLVNGSLNWSKKAFQSNHDCFLILHAMQVAQIEKMKQLWHMLRSSSRLPDKEHLSILRERPPSVIDHLFESIPMAA